MTSPPSLLLLIWVISTLLASPFSSSPAPSLLSTLDLPWAGGPGADGMEVVVVAVLVVVDPDPLPALSVLLLPLPPPLIPPPLTGALHPGHVAFLLSHSSTHSVWKKWLHGSLLHTSPESNSDRQI